MSGKNALPYYKKYPRDFIEGTIGMTLELKGAYALVLDLIYMQSGQLPDDPHYISGLLGCTVRKWNSIRKILIEKDKIQIIGEFITNYRAVTEVQTQRTYQDKQSRNRTGNSKNNNLRETTVKPFAPQPEPEPVEEERDTKVSPKKTTPRQILETVLTPETAGDVLDHRQRMRKPLTSRAATLLIGELQKCRDGPQVAADVMILAGWQSFKNDWYENRKNGNAATRNGPPDPNAQRDEIQRWVDGDGDLLGEGEGDARSDRDGVIAIGSDQGR